MDKRDWFTIPNILSYFRLILIPFFVYFYLTAVTAEDYWLATGILVLSGVTDAADGFIARRFDQGTKIGQLLDPVADKLTQIAVVSVLMLRWPVFSFLLLLFIIKEGYMFVENIRLYRKKITLDGSKWYGKIATIVFYLTMFIAVFFPNLSNVTVIFLVILASAYQLLALFYYVKLFKYLHKSKEN
ncbi:CDP-alcohol phosphatidyltransferase family protein [Alkalibacterium sp. f15]|uniref:CDP-alcohol phosphatidyltransferase family protein n=1 Tax=Alkalibacterium sp. f15 TaxID=3414029 RepID=UPI003BF828CA